MGRLLAIESATDFVSVALLEGDRLLAERVSEQRTRHTATLLPAIDGLLGETGTSLDGIEAFAVSSGPGSFTSLRIGLATVKGLALSRDIPAIGVSTLEAMALAVLEGGAHGGSPVVALLDARRGEWYAGAWHPLDDAEGMPRPVLAEGLYAPAGLAAHLTDPVVLVAPDAGAAVDALREAGLATAAVILGEPARPRAQWVGRLARRRLARGEGGPAARLAARYLRRAQAEAQRLGELVEPGVALEVDPD